MTEQTGRPFVEEFDPDAEHDDSSGVTVAKQDGGHRAEGEEKPLTSAAEAIARATAALGGGDGAHR